MNLKINFAVCRHFLPCAWDRAHGKAAVFAVCHAVTAHGKHHRQRGSGHCTLFCRVPTANMHSPVVYLLKKTRENLIRYGDAPENAQSVLCQIKFAETRHCFLNNDKTKFLLFLSSSCCCILRRGSSRLRPQPPIAPANARRIVLRDANP